MAVQATPVEAVRQQQVGNPLKLSPPLGALLEPAPLVQQPLEPPWVRLSFWPALWPWYERV